MDIQVGDKLTMKKPHPCGSKEWLVLRTGMDFKLKCQVCGREVMIDRLEFTKKLKKVLGEENEEA